MDEQNREDAGTVSGRGPARDPRHVRFDDLAAEVEALSHETNRLLVRRRKIQARIKSLVHTLLKSGPDAGGKLGASLEKEFAAADENSLYIEVWLPEFRQINEALVEQGRELLEGLEAAPEADGNIVSELETARQREAQLRQRADAFETERMLLNERLQVEREEAERLGRTCRELEAHVAELNTRLELLQDVPYREVESRLPDPDEEDLRARLKEAEARYQEVAMGREKDRRTNAREVASMTKQLTQLRDRYERQIGQLMRRCEELNDALAGGKGRTQGQVDGAESPQSAKAPGRLRSLDDVAPAARNDGGSNLAATAEKRVREERGTDRDSGSRAKGAARDQILILDGDAVGQGAAENLVERGYPVSAFAPHSGLAAELPLDTLSAVAVNLAARDAWPTVRQMLEAGVAPPAWIGYAAARASPAVYWFGRVSFLRRPVDRKELGDTLRSHGARLKQVLVLSHDEDYGSQLVRDLGRARLTGALARDRADTLEVIKTIYPHAVVAHPSSRPVDVFRALGALRNVSLFARTPVVFILDEAAGDHEGALFSGAVRAILRMGRLRAVDFSEVLASALSPFLKGKSSVASAGGC